MVADRVTSKARGCLDYLLSLALSGELQLHREIPFEEVTKGEPIGEGMAGTVWRGLWRERRVAIKEFRKDVRWEDFYRELSIMSVVQHENLVRCLGGCTKNGRRLLIMELMAVRPPHPDLPISPTSLRLTYLTSWPTQTFSLTMVCAIVSCLMWPRVSIISTTTATWFIGTSRPSTSWSLSRRATWPSRFATLVSLAL